MFCSFLTAQQPSASASSAVVPRLVNFSGRAIDAQGKIITGIAGATFAIYKDQYEGSPLWLETQNVQADAKGNFTAQLGATKPEGLPLDLFTSGEARWLGVTLNGAQEQPRILLLSVPYALKAADAETVGGLPASAFALANKPQENAAAAPTALTANRSKNTAPPPANPAVTGKGVVDFIPMWDTTSDIVDSVMFQKNSQIGVNTSAPAATLDVNGKSDVRDTLTLFPKGTDPTLAINGTTFKVDRTGKVAFVSGQTFPGTGTITGVSAGTDLTGGGASGNVTLNLDTSKVPQLNSANAFTGNQGVIGTITATGSVGIGTTSPAASLDVFASTAGIHAPMGQFGSSGAADCNSIRTYTGSGSTEIFQAQTGCFVPGAVAGDGGMRVNSGSKIILGDSGTARLTIDSNGNAEQSIYSGGLVKAMAIVDQTGITFCYNSTLTGVAAESPPCNFLFQEWGVGDYTIDFQFNLIGRVVSATPGGAFGGASNNYGPIVTACLWVLGETAACNNAITITQVELTNTDRFATYRDNQIFVIVY
jgi:hypothetical protein